MAELKKLIDSPKDVKPSEGSDAWFWEGYLKEDEDEPRWVDEALGEKEEKE